MDFLKKAAIIQWNAWKNDLLLLANKLIKNGPDPRNAKEHCQSFIITKNRKSVRKLEIITYQPKTFDIADVESAITEHPKSSHKLSKTVRKGEKVGSNSCLYSDTKKVKILWMNKI